MADDSTSSSGAALADDVASSKKSKEKELKVVPFESLSDMKPLKFIFQCKNFFFFHFYSNFLFFLFKYESRRKKNGKIKKCDAFFAVNICS